MCKCQFCAREFESPTDLKVHYYQSYPFCSYCQGIFQSGDALQQHLHNDCVMYTLAMVRLYARGPAPNLWEQPSGSTDHGRQGGNVDQNPPAQTSRSTAHLETSPSGFQCNLCKKSYEDKKALEHHFNTIHGSTKFQCEICPNEFRLRGDLSKHVEDIHAEPRYFPCLRCRKMYPTKERLKEHYALAHGRKYECDRCSLKFDLKSTLRHHQNDVHDACGICGKMFMKRSSLRLHLRRQLYQCSDCPEKFCYKTALDEHFSKTHMPDRYFCTTCEKSFSTKSQWQTHECIEDVYKPGKYYKCHLCNSVFHSYFLSQLHFYIMHCK